MKILRLALFIFLALCVTMIAAVGQELPPPGLINLLPGYHHRGEQGIDSRVGTIWKKNGLQIHYDIGELAGNYTGCRPLCDWTDGEVWRKKQLINGQQIICVFTNKKRLVISFPDAHANFYATIRTQQQLTDMLLMLFTFQSAVPGNP
jgi:hypothetical protein